MMNERRRTLKMVQVDQYDGQSIYSNNELIYELGGYLGGGAAGVVYEAFCMRTKRHVAIKILNPVGYKLVPATLLARCVVVVKGKPLINKQPPLDDDQATTTRLQLENVSWLLHPTTKQTIAAIEDERTGMLRELTLPQCIDVWGTDHAALDRTSCTGSSVPPTDQSDYITRMPKKFRKFMTTRQSMQREIGNMSELDLHPNVLRLDAALEFVQATKCTTFLVLELAGGGELFDRIKLDCGTDEATARAYFRQLVAGVAFCHASGVCHRDLKPENLLLADSVDNDNAVENDTLATLKIADFGLSAIFAIADKDKSDDASSNSSNIRRLRSVVGSPHYVAPEVLLLDDASDQQGYDGAKADAWSIGVILYAMLAGSLPFGKELLTCSRYDKFRTWAYNTKYSDEDCGNVDNCALADNNCGLVNDNNNCDNPAQKSDAIFPNWFFPAHFSRNVKSLIAQLLFPDPSMRLAVCEAQRHPWARAIAEATMPATATSVSPSLSSAMHAPDNSPRQGVAIVAMTPAESPAMSTASPISPMKHTSDSSSTCGTKDSGAGLTAATDDATPLDVRVAEPASACRDQHYSNATSNDVEATIVAVALASTRVSADSVDCEPSTTPTLSQSALLQQQQNVSDDAVRQFVSPPLALDARSSATFHDNNRHRRNSPPELSFFGFAKTATRLHAIQPFDRELLNPSDCNSTNDSNSSAMDATTLPSPSRTCNDHVARSTRFVTALPAPLVLAKIDAILAANPSPLPYPFTNVPQHVAIDWRTYRLDVHYGSLLTCTVQVYLYERGVYLVEFRRGQVEIFQFKRFYEDIREKIANSSIDNISNSTSSNTATAHVALPLSPQLATPSVSPTADAC